jgi:hypothetical protein
MAIDKSEGGDYYNNSTLEFIKNQNILFNNNKRFPIIEKLGIFYLIIQKIFLMRY